MFDVKGVGLTLKTSTKGGYMPIPHSKEIALYKRAVKAWGVDLQLWMIVEECAELIKEVAKVSRGYGSLEELAGEVADVDIMLGQIKTHFRIEHLVDLAKTRKLCRLATMLDESEV